MVYQARSRRALVPRSSPRTAQRRARSCERFSDAESHGQAARYVTVITANARYVFSPHDLVVKSKKSLIVEAYAKLYVYPLDGAMISYSGSSAPVSLDSIPSVSADALDKRIADVGAKHRSVAHDACGDCAVVLTGRKASGTERLGWSGGSVAGSSRLPDASRVGGAVVGGGAQRSGRERRTICHGSAERPPATSTCRTANTCMRMTTMVTAAEDRTVGAQPPAPPCNPLSDPAGTLTNMINGNAKLNALAGKIGDP